MSDIISVVSPPNNAIKSSGIIYKARYKKLRFNIQTRLNLAALYGNRVIRIRRYMETAL